MEHRIKRGVRARPKATEFVRFHAPQYITEHDDHHDRIVQLPEDGDEIRDQVNRTDQVGKKDDKRRLPPPFNSRSRQEPLEQHHAIRNEAGCCPRIALAPGKEKAEDNEQIQANRGDQGRDKPCRERLKQ
jgi:hypothetical protein